MTRAVSIRRRLILELVVGICLLSGSIMAATFLANRRAVATLSSSILEQVISGLESDLAGFFDPVVAGLRTVIAWGEEGLATLDAPDRLELLLRPLLAGMPQVSTIHIVDEDGREYRLYRDATVAELPRSEEAGPGISLPFAPPAEDPRQRTWYRSAALAGEGYGEAPQWTFPHTHGPGEAPRMTVSLAGRFADGRLYVVGFDVLAEDVSRFTMGRHVSREGRAAILTADNRFLGLPADPRFSDPEARRAAYLVEPQELGIPLIEDAARALTAREGDDSSPVRFRSEGRLWWGQLRSLPLGPQQSLAIAVALPDSDLFRERLRIDLLIVGVTFVILIVAATRAAWLARRFGEPIEALVRESDRISRGDLEARPPIKSDLAEVRQLAAAQQRMRDGLRSLMRLERDLQIASQIQQKTLPETLPVVSGYDIDAWSQPAQETGGDTFDVVPLSELDGADRRVLFLLADASGHGIGPAITATQTRSMLRMALRFRGNPTDTVRHMNEQLVADLPVNAFVTCWLAVLDPSSGAVESFSAGLGPLFHYRERDDAVRLLDSDSLPLGIVRDLEVPEKEPLILEPGDILLVASDGILDAFASEHESFGSGRVLELLHARHDQSAKEILGALRRELTAFTASWPADDDRTVIVLKRRR